MAASPALVLLPADLAVKVRAFFASDTALHSMVVDLDGLFVAILKKSAAGDFFVGGGFASDAAANGALTGGAS